MNPAERVLGLTWQWKKETFGRRSGEVVRPRHNNVLSLRKG